LDVLIGLVIMTVSDDACCSKLFLVCELGAAKKEIVRVSYLVYRPARRDRTSLFAFSPVYDI
jgi:hypothetical protein